ncbi:hypothetical protein HIM_11453 [Hirsutella minnesotensis 3608]|uniref:Metallo-beta-lactamase domain-containing protein n=1 Tax=Hirsutella minnesotensis 3608 TaxID=1043627 RepID=A0A0F7ZWK9_9HYPO|nr:hypothetical protein HIM_11453 [Hirsutella minnesotensis 3608]
MLTSGLRRLNLLSFFCAISQATSALTTYSPIPTQAQGPPLNSAGWRVEHFGGGAYMVTDNQYQAFFLVSTEGVIVVDAPPSIGENMLYAIGNATHIPITYVIYSHAHTDHIGDAYLYGDSVTRIAQEMTKEILEGTPDAKPPVPNLIFDEEYTLYLGNQTLHLTYRGPNHQPGNIFIYAPQQKVLMLVDVIEPGWVPFSLLDDAVSLPGLFKAHDQVLKYDFDHFIGGHVTRSGTRADVTLAREYLNDLKANCARAFSLSKQPSNSTNPISAQEILPAVAAANPGNVFATFKVILDSVACHCNNATKSKWQGKLAGADVFGFENAYKMTFWLNGVL